MKTRVYAMCFSAFLVGVLVSALVYALVVGGLAHAASQTNPHTVAPIMCPYCHLGDPDTGHRLAGKDFRNAYMPFMASPHVNLAGTDFSGADLYAWIAAGVSASSARFEGTDLTQAEFLLGSDFSHADFSYAVLVKTTFQSANFSGALFRNANLLGAHDQGGNTFTGATWANTICPDGTNSDVDGHTCLGHFL